MPRWWIPPQFIIQLHAISVKGELAVIIWIIWINHLCGWHFPIWSYYVLQWSLVQCEWIVERKPENKPLQNHICCQKRDYLFTKTTSQSFPTNSFTGEIGFQTTRIVEEVVRMVRKLSHHSGPQRQKITRSKLIRWSMRWVEMRTRFWKAFISQKGHHLHVTE